MYKKFILQDNACEAWAMAIKYCDYILAGKITLLNRKYFVESLHNAVELFMKQLMLNKNDYRVATVRRFDNGGEPLKSYLAANDLNKYFGNIDSEVLKKFYSIEFNEIIEHHRKIVPEHFVTHPSITEQLKLLQKLRNDETHFYIERSSFLSEEEFRQLYNLMIAFYEILLEYRLLPYWGKPDFEHIRLSFDRTALSSCSYINLLMQSPYVQKLIKLIDGQQYWGNPTDSAFSIADCLVNNINELKNEDFDDLFVYIEMLLEYGKLLIDGGYNEYTDEYGLPYSEPDFFIMIAD